MSNTSEQIPEESIAVQEKPPVMGFPERLIGIIFYPAKVFESIREDPVILGPICALILMGIVQVPIMAPYNSQMIESQIRSVNPEATQEQIENAKQLAESTTSLAIGTVAIVFVVPLFMTMISGIYWTIFTVTMGTGATFRSIFSVVGHSQLISIIGAIVYASLTVIQDETVISLHLGNLVPFLESDDLIYLVLKRIDIFTGWWLCLLSIGFGILFRMKTTTAAIVPFSLWALWIIVEVAAADFLGKFIPGF